MRKMQRGGDGEGDEHGGADERKEEKEEPKASHPIRKVRDLMMKAEGRVKERSPRMVRSARYMPTRRELVWEDVGAVEHDYCADVAEEREM